MKVQALEKFPVWMLQIVDQQFHLYMYQEWHDGDIFYLKHF